MTVKIQARRDTAANWTSANPVLSSGEPGFEIDTNKLKIGDGTTAWNSLDYIGGGDAAGADTQIQFNTAGQFDASANLTYDGALNVKGLGTTSATQSLTVSNSSSTNLFTIRNDGSVSGLNIGINEFPSALRMGAAAAASATGSNWLAFGGLAAQNNVTGGGWTAIGRTAGNGNISGSNWTAIGISSGLNNVEGGNWIAIGYRAGRFVSGSTSPLVYFNNSVYFGTDTKGTNGTQASPTTNETVIGYAAEGNGSNTVTIGSSAVTANYFRGRIETTSSGTTSATQALKLSNSSSTNLFTVNDDGTFNGKNIAIGEYTGATRIGESAGINATGNFWAAVGTNAGYNNTTGDSWLALGTNAGFSNTTGDYWTAIGFDTGRSNTTGSFWAALGLNAGYNNTTGSAWVAIGTFAGYSNLAGNAWTAIGINAAVSNTTGSSWLALGTNSARYQSGTAETALTAFDNGTYLGSETRGTEGATNETVIGYEAQGNGSNTVTIGSSAVTANYFRGRIETTSSGTTSATQALKLSNSAATNLLTVRDDGTMTGANLGIGETTGSARLGTNSAPVATGTFWTAFGNNAGLSNTTGDVWTAIGSNAGRSNIGGDAWVAIGDAAAFSNTSGQYFMALGQTAGYNNTSGSNWTAIGRSAAFSSTTGNTFTAIGSNAGRANTTGSGWVAIGDAVAYSSILGSDWVAIGAQAGRYRSGTTLALQYFQNSTYIGTLTKGTNGTSTVLTDNETVIGYAAEGKGSNTVTIGSSAVTDNYFTGDIHAQGSGKGIIVTSPDGLTTRRIGIDNSGNLVITTP